MRYLVAMFVLYAEGANVTKYVFSNVVHDGRFQTELRTCGPIDRILTI